MTPPFLGPWLTLPFLDPLVTLQFVDPELMLPFLDPLVTLQFVDPELMLPFLEPWIGHAGGALARAGNVSLVVFFLVGLLGGAHCLGMCGPLVTLYADRLPGDDRGPSWYELRQHAAFNFGRTLGYAAVGALMGLLGGLVFDVAGIVTAVDRVRAVAGLAAGLFIVAAGVGYLYRGTAGAGPSLPLVGGAFSRVYGVLAGRITEWARGPRIVVLGVVHAALPCPLLYPAFLYALAVGDPATGAASLAALGLGTFPALFAYGALLGTVGSRRRVLMHRVLGVLFILLGYIPLSHGLMVLGVELPHPPIPIYQPLG